MEGLGADRVKTTKAKLEGELNKTIQLRPLAIRKLETTLQYTPVREETPTTPAPEPTTVGTGNMENEAPESNGEYWTQRTYTLYPDNETSQLLWSAFEKGQVALSLSYTFFANGVESSASGGTATGNIPPPEADEPPEPKVMAVNGDVVNVTVDGLKERSRFKRIDINQSVPANYAALRLYCFDFNNELREDLYQKTVEIRATSVTGKRILESVAFAKTTPDITSASLKFKFAIDLKKPYEYRVRQVLLTGEEKVGSWKTVKNWNQILDVTTPKEELPKKPEDPPRKSL
jgi:hypothetical protein